LSGEKPIWRQIVGHGWVEWGLRIACILGWIITIIAFIVMDPFSTKLGVSGSPLRIPLVYIYAFVGCLPMAILFMYHFLKHPEWNVPPGKYVPGMKVKFLTPYTYSAIAITAALFAIAGVGNPLRVDLQALVIATTAAYFGGPVSFAGLWIGQMIAQVFLFPTGESIISIIGWVTIDASIWACAGLVYHKILYDKAIKNRTLGLVVAYLIVEQIHSMPPFGYWWVYNFIVNPLEAMPAWLISYWSYWPLSWTVVVVGLLAGISARRAVGGEAAVSPLKVPVSR